MAWPAANTWGRVPDTWIKPFPSPPCVDCPRRPGSDTVQLAHCFLVSERADRGEAEEGLGRLDALKGFSFLRVADSWVRLLA